MQNKSNVTIIGTIKWHNLMPFGTRLWVSFLNIKTKKTKTELLLWGSCISYFQHLLSTSSKTRCEFSIKHFQGLKKYESATTWWIKIYLLFLNESHKWEYIMQNMFLPHHPPHPSSCVKHLVVFWKISQRYFFQCSTSDDSKIFIITNIHNCWQHWYDDSIKKRCSFQWSSASKSQNEEEIDWR